jgi:predicted small metal-binding protein
MAADPPENGPPTELIVTCACGFEARGVPAELIPLVQRHGREVHNMAATAEDVLALARPADQG